MKERFVIKPVNGIHKINDGNGDIPDLPAIYSEDFNLATTANCINNISSWFDKVRIQNKKASK